MPHDSISLAFSGTIDTGPGTWEQRRRELLAEHPNLEPLDLRHDGDRARVLELLLRFEIDHAADLQSPCVPRRTEEAVHPRMQFPIVVQRLESALCCLDGEDLADLRDAFENLTRSLRSAAQADGKRGVRDAIAALGRVAVRIEELARPETRDDLQALMVDCAEAFDGASHAATTEDLRDALAPLRDDSQPCRALHKTLAAAATAIENSLSR